MSLEIDEKRAGDLAKKFVGMLEAKVYPFDDKDLFPDAILPEGIKEGSKEHALFLFYSCSVDSMRVAENVYAAMRDMASAVDIDKIGEISKEDIRRLLHKYLEDQKLPDLAQARLWEEAVEIRDTGMGKPVRTLYENSRKLASEYGDDPRNIQTGDIDETFGRICSFRQLGIGKAALYMKNMVKFGMWDFDPCEIPIKIDRHAIRISFGTGVLKTEEDKFRTHDLEEVLSALYRKVTSKLRISAVDLNDAMWAIGSKLCSTNDYRVCQDLCKGDCSIRPWSDRNARWIYPKQESRESSSEFLDYYL